MSACNIEKCVWPGDEASRKGVPNREVLLVLCIDLLGIIMTITNTYIIQLFHLGQPPLLCVGHMIVT